MRSDIFLEKIFTKNIRLINIEKSHLHTQLIQYMPQYKGVMHDKKMDPV